MLTTAVCRDKGHFVGRFIVIIIIHADDMQSREKSVYVILCVGVCVCV